MASYSEYLKLDQLLVLQESGDEHDEMLFIIIHQAYELWFKEVLHELDYLIRLLGKNDLPRASQTIKRVLTILKVLVAQVDILETMTPLEFGTFRERLETSSGFQSVQFRELEIVLGKNATTMIERFSVGSVERLKLEQRLCSPSLWNAFVAYLHRDIAPLQNDPRDLQQILVNIYRSNPTIAAFCERLVDLDEGLQEWRYRHLKMVERTIGMKVGTGGSKGADYLRTTLLEPVFPDLWAIRNQF